MNRALGIVVLTLTLSACGGSDERDAQKAIREAVQAYSDAYLTGESDTAYDLLSERCKERTSRADFAGLVAQAKDLYGTALPVKTFAAEVNGTQARVTYTYKISAINQTDEPWVKEAGDWHQDDC